MNSDFQGSFLTAVTNPSIKSTTASRNSHLHRSQRFSVMNHDCLNIMYKDKMLCDVVLIAEGLEVPAHKLMLAASSAFFYWKFSKKRHLRVINRIEIPNLTYETLSAVVRYLYECEILINEQNVRDLSAAACLLSLKDLQSACRNFLKANLNLRNCVRTKCIATELQYEELVATARDYMVSQFSEFVKQDEFLKMNHDQVNELIDIDSLCTSDEEEVLDSIIRWVNNDLQHRKDHIYNLMDKVWFWLIPSKNILQRLQAEKWLTLDPHYNAFMFKVLKSHIEESPMYPPKQRPSSKYVMVVGITYGFLLNVEFYDLEKNIWFSNVEIPTMKLSCYTQAAILGSIIYVIEKKSLKYFNTKDPAQQEWLECTKLQENKKHFGMVACNGMVYAVGGRNNGDVSSAHRIDESSRECKKMRSMPEAKSCVGLGVLQGNIYVVGGAIFTLGSGCYLNSVERYQSASDTWYSMPSMSIKRSHTGVTSIGDTLYVAGGWDGAKACKQVEAFNLLQYSWKRLADMCIARSDPAVIAVNGQLYVFGGYDGKILLNSTEVYDPKSNTWTMLSSMNTAKRYVSVGLVDKAKKRLDNPQKNTLFTEVIQP